jgi:uncharacterized membrane-anchored protein
MNLSRRALAHLWIALAPLASSFAQPADPAQEAPPATREQAFTQAGVKLVPGPAKVPLGTVAELTVPAGFHFVGPDSLDRFYELTQNSRSGQEVGVLMSPSDWMLFFDFDPVGYVKDDDKDQLDPQKLMSAMTEGEEESNAARQERGWEAIKVAGWATQPHYDEKTNHLKWAINLTSSADNHQEVWINESIRLLGRSGVMKATLVADAPLFKQAEAEAEALLAGSFDYVSGEKYTEFKPGDRIAEYGLAALVVGGAGAMAAKAGLFAKLASFLGKAWKLVVFAVVGLGVAISKLWNRITGAKAPPA